MECDVQSIYFVIENKCSFLYAFSEFWNVETGKCLNVVIWDAWENYDALGDHGTRSYDVK